MIHMTEQPSPPIRPAASNSDPVPTAPLPKYGGAMSRPGTPGPPQVHPFGPMRPAGPPPGYAPQPPPRRTGRIIGAALLVGALAGGAAGAGTTSLLADDSDNSTVVRTSNPDADSSNQPASISLPDGSTEAAAAAVLPSVVKIYVEGAQASGSGSGVVLSSDGEILTNNHVVEAAAEGGRIAVSFEDGTSAEATILGRDPLTDLAVIKAEDVSDLNPADIGSSDTLSVGQQVIALGAPYGLESTVTTGIVSALNRPVSTQGEDVSDPATVLPAIQTDAAINPGNSGGPLIDLSGKVIGIDTAIKTSSGSEGSQGGSIGLGFAIPIDDAMPVVEQLRAGEAPTHAVIGVSVQDAADDVGLPDGALVGEVESGSAADDAGLDSGTVITKVDDHVISDADSLVATVRTYRPGDEVTLTVSTATSDGTSTGDTDTLNVTLGSDVD